MPSLKSTRSAPERVFENYTFNRVISPEVGLFPIATKNLRNVAGIAGGGGSAGASGGDDGLSAFPIGFDFKLDSITYKNIIVSTNGWVILVDPASSIAVPSTIATHCMSTQYDNTTIISQFVDGFGAQKYHALLCPWFDDLRNMFSDQQELLTALGTPSVTQQNLVNEGKAIPNVAYNQVNAGVKYINTIAKNGGRCLVIRWHSMSNFADSSTLLNFDLVIYENGTIEFRYKPNSSIHTSDPLVEGATIGIFLNNSATAGWRFRDFSYGSGYDDKLREQYPLGAAVYTPGYLDNTKVYTNGLRPDRHWPGLRTQGCIISFIPPLSRRKVLPRNVLREQDSKITFPLIARTGDVDRSGTHLISFDDRRSINFVNSVIDYPTRIPRMYAADELETTSRLNVFGTFSLTGAIDKNSADEFIGDQNQRFINPFNEVHQPEQNGSISEYYTTGSRVDNFGGGFSSHLMSKTQLKFELPIQYPTKMFDVTSSIYYYNKTIKGFLIPGTTAGNVNAKKDLADPIHTSVLSDSYPEDARGFSALGSTISSGSLPGSISGYGFQSDHAIGFGGTGFGPFKLERQGEILSRYYSKSVQNNSDYAPHNDEQFTLPINQPFLIEKIVFEMPFTMGAGWLNDKTTCGHQVKYGGSIIGNSFDVAGPAITIALYNQINSGVDIIRDLILTGTIIPHGDNISNVKSYESQWAPAGPSIPFYIFAPEGFLSFGCTPSSVVSANIGTNFTGSVIVPTVAGVSNGITIGYYAAASDFATITAGQVAANRKLAKKFLTNEFTSIDYDYTSIVSYVKDIDTYGRSGKSFDPSGRSVFGKEFITTQGTTAGSHKFRNPLFVSSSYDDFPERIKSAINDSAFSAILATAIPLSNPTPSPYLVMPGDKLTLSISKMRPLLYSKGLDPDGGGFLDFFTGSLRHDVSISTGSIKMTIYGSLVRDGVEFHDTLNSTIASNAIHQAIGNEPVLDQFDVEPRSSYYGSSTDDYITGSLLTRISAGGLSSFTQGTRGKVFSKYLARSQAVPESSPSTGYEVRKNTSKSFRLQPWYERVGNDRTIQITSTAERYYDSMMPAANTCFRENGANIFILDGASSLALAGPTNLNRPNVGYIFFNANSIEYPGLCDDTWTWSYPFEPRYAGITRELNLKYIKSAMRRYDTAGGFVTKILKQKLIDLMFVNRGFYGTNRGSPAAYSVGNNSYETWCDVDLSSGITPPQTGSMSLDEMSKCLFGFGDSNTLQYRDLIYVPAVVSAPPDPLVDSIAYYYGSSSNGVEPQPTYGGNHLPEFKHNDYAASPELQTAFGAIIRGWKYGVASGLPLFSKCIYRRNHYGQFRDMLEQRPYTKYYITEDAAAGVGGRPSKERPGVLTGPISVKFVDSSGNITKPELTWSQNLSLEVTSSFPYLDGEYRNRSEVDIAALNESTVLI